MTVFCTTGNGSGILSWSPLHETWAWQLYLRKCWNPSAAATPVVPVITRFPSLESVTYSKVSRSEWGPRLEFTLMRNLEACFGMSRVMRSFTACSCTAWGVFVLIWENCLNLELLIFNPQHTWIKIDPSVKSANPTFFANMFHDALSVSDANATDGRAWSRAERLACVATKCSAWLQSWTKFKEKNGGNVVPCFEEVTGW